MKPRQLRVSPASRRAGVWLCCVRGHPSQPSICSRCCGSGQSCPRRSGTQRGALGSSGPSSASASWTSTSQPSWRTWRRSCTDSPRNEAHPALGRMHTTQVIKGWKTRPTAVFVGVLFLKTGESTFYTSLHFNKYTEHEFMQLQLRTSWEPW